MRLVDKETGFVFKLIAEHLHCRMAMKASHERVFYHMDFPLVQHFACYNADLACPHAREESSTNADLLRSNKDG